MSQQYPFTVSESTFEVSKGDIGGVGLPGLNSTSDSAHSSFHHEPAKSILMDVIRDAALDPRFDSFFKRVSWFQQEGETDKDFAARLEVSHNVFKTWKYKGRVPRLASTAINLSKLLNVSIMWLMSGQDHYVRVLPGGIRLTSFPKLDTYYFIEELPDKDGRLPSLYAPDGAITQ